MRDAVLPDALENAIPPAPAAPLDLPSVLHAGRRRVRKRRALIASTTLVVAGLGCASLASPAHSPLDHVPQPAASRPLTARDEGGDQDLYPLLQLKFDPTTGSYTVPDGWRRLYLIKSSALPVGSAIAITDDHTSFFSLPTDTKGSGDGKGPIDGVATRAEFNRWAWHKYPALLKRPDVAPDRFDGTMLVSWSKSHELTAHHSLKLDRTTYDLRVAGFAGSGGRVAAARAHFDDGTKWFVLAREHGSPHVINVRDTGQFETLSEFVLWAADTLSSKAGDR